MPFGFVLDVAGERVRITVMVSEFTKATYFNELNLNLLPLLCRLIIICVTHSHVKSAGDTSSAFSNEGVVKLKGRSELTFV